MSSAEPTLQQHFNSREESESNRLNQIIIQARRSSNLLGESIGIAEGVYLDIVNVSEKQVELIKRSDVMDDENVLFLDMGLTLLEPSIFYLKLLNEVGIVKKTSLCNECKSEISYREKYVRGKMKRYKFCEPCNKHLSIKDLLFKNKFVHVPREDCLAQIDGFTTFKRDNGMYSVFPVISGGGLNPYIKYRSNRISAHRRMDVFDNLSKIVNQKITIMNLNFTFPKQISNYLFDDPDGEIKSKQVYDLFWKKFLESGIIKIDHQKTQSLKNMDLGIHSNFHKSSSKDPFKPHYHFHDTFPNFLYDKLKKSFVRIKPYFKNGKSVDSEGVKCYNENLDDLKKIRLLWYESQKEILHYGEDNGSVYSEFDIEPDEDVVWFQYLPGYDANIEKPKKPKEDLNLTSNDMQEYKEKYLEFKTNQRARNKISHHLKYCTRSYLVDVGNYFDYYNSDNDQVRFAKFYPYLKKQFKRFIELGCVQNKTSTKGFLRKLRKITTDIDSRHKTKFYEKIYCSEHKVTYRCPVTGYESAEKPRKIHGFPDIKSLNVYMAYKSGVAKISEFYFKKIEEFV